MQKQRNTTKGYRENFRNAWMGSYVAPEVCCTGQSGSVDYYKAQRCAVIARENPTMLAMSGSCATVDIPFYDAITPKKPMPVTLAGVDVFGPPSFHSSTRNMSYDIRGEAANKNIFGPPPVGGGFSGRMGGVPDSYWSGGSFGCVPKSTINKILPPKSVLPRTVKPSGRDPKDEIVDIARKFFGSYTL